MGPAEALSPNKDFLIAQSVLVNGSPQQVTVKSFPGKAASRVAVDGSTPCDPNDVLYGVVDPATCPNVRDVWTFTWDGTNNSSETVTAGDFTVVDQTASTNVGTVTATQISIQGVTANRASPIVLAPYHDGIADAVTVTFSGVTYGSVPIPTTGSAEITRQSTGTLVSHVDFVTDQVSHSVPLVAGNYPIGTYVLTVDLVFGGVHKQKTWTVKVVPTQINATTVVLSSGVFFPARDGYRDIVSIRLASSTSTGTWIPVTGWVEIFHGGRVELRIPLRRSDQTVTWNGTVSGRVTPPGGYLVRAVIRGPEGAPRTSADARLVVAQTRVTRAALVLSAGSVFPVRDGYRDSVTFSTAGTASTGQLIRVAGSLQVLDGSRVLWTVPVRNTGGNAYVWNGRTGGSVEPGSFVVKLTLRGPEGAAISRTARIVVSGKHLVTHHTSSSATYTARYAFNACRYDASTTTVDCSLWDWYIGSTLYTDTVRYASYGGVLAALNSVPLPAGTTSYRIRSIADTYGGEYALFYCNDSACDGGHGYPTNSAGEFVPSYTSLMSSDRRAHFIIGVAGDDRIFIARFMVDARRTWTVLE